ncbi:MAG: SDR family oxidoreductase, partial [Pseudomonadota bacterium]
MRRLLEGKAGAIVGASSGIGAAAAKLFAEEGARVVLVARRRDRLDGLAAQIVDSGGDAVAVRADITAAGSHDRIVAETLARFGRFDFAFNNAGTIGNFVPMLDQSEEDWDRTLAVNLKSVWMSVRAQAAAMIERGGGAIVNTSSWLSVGALPGSTSYSASKAGMDGLLRAAALELAPHGIRINNVNPGGIETAMTREALGHDTELIAAFGRAHPLGRLGSPREAAELAAAGDRFGR